MTAKLKVNGKRGSWFAEINGVSYPCVHRFWVVQHGKSMTYSDPMPNPEDRHWPDFIAALQSQKKAILTEDESFDSGKGFNRTGYIALYEIDEIVKGTSLRFRFVKRLAECQ
jgi:hypothetical protein